MINTKFTHQLDIRHPIVLAPMCGMSAGKLAGQVANAGGLGLIGVGAELVYDADWVNEQNRIAQEQSGTSSAGGIGLGFIACAMKPNDASFNAALETSPTAIYLGFADTYDPWIDRAHEAGAHVICQVHTLRQARLALAAGADTLALQGCDAGGHGQQHLATSIISLVPQARDIFGSDINLLAAGGIADGRGLAAALALGSDGVVMGSRFVTATESIADQSFKERIVETRFGDEGTIVSSSFDILGKFPWPEQFRQSRALSDSETVRRFHQPVGSPQHKATSDEKEWYANGDYGIRAVFTSAASGLINEIEDAKSIIEKTMSEAQTAIKILRSE
jgi:nitronate monooxygenase